MKIAARWPIRETGRMTQDWWAERQSSWSAHRPPGCRCGACQGWMRSGAGAIVSVQIGQEYHSPDRCAQVVAGGLVR